MEFDTDLDGLDPDQHALDSLSNSRKTLEMMLLRQITVTNTMMVSMIVKACEDRMRSNERIEQKLITMERNFLQLLRESECRLRELTAGNNNKIEGNGRKMREVKQLTATNASMLARESRMSNNEQKFAVMNASFQELLRETESKLRELRARRMEEDGKGMSSIDRPPDRDIAFQISGINNIKEYIKEPANTDPAEIVVMLMELFDVYHAVSRIMLVGIKGTTRQTADAAIVYMSSTFYKKKATCYLRQFLKMVNQQGYCHEVTVKDCFDRSEQPRARALNRYAGYLRQEGRIHGFRIINRQGSAILQTHSGQEDWTELTVQPEELEPWVTG